MGRTMPQHAAKLTYEELVLFPDDGRRHELIDGEHFMTPAPSTRHQRALRELNRLLDAFVRERALGEVFFAPYDVVLSTHDVVEPDLLFVSHGRAGILTPDNARGAPDLVVEVVSAGSRRQDEVLKRGLYERAGVPEYWLVDPDAETVKVFRAEGERYGRALLLSLRDEDVLTTPRLPGLAIPLRSIFAS